MRDIRTTGPEFDLLRDGVQALCARFDESYWEQRDAEHAFPHEFFKAFADAGYTGLVVPEEYGGSGGGIAEACAVLEEVAAAGGGLNACSAVHTSMISLHAMIDHADDAFRTEYLPPIASGEMRACFGVTEPTAGTDTTKITTFARRRGDDYVISGQKTWISNAQNSDRMLLLARTKKLSECERKTDGMSLFFVDLKSPGLSITPIRKIARNAVDSNEIFIDDVVVPATDLVGEEGKGFRYILDGLNGERVMIAAEAVGFGRWSLNHAVDYARQRRVFDRAIGQNQAVQHPLAAGYMQLRAAASMVREAIEIFGSNPTVAEMGTAANTAKYLAAEAAFFTADAAMQTYGGYAFAREYHIGRYWMESRLQRIAPLNNQMILNYISERVLQLPRSY
jgi:acyl-CoA dehydrogenase